jgi:hypothetical protein
MKVQAQRAVYGEVNGAHTLIAPKVNALPELAKITRFTDRPGHLPPHISWQPYFSGYPFEDYYVLSITFPDPIATRAGMVLTHVLLFKLEEAILMSDLMPALLALPPKPERDIGDDLVNIVIRDETQHVAAPPGLVSVVHNLLEEEQGEKPAVWVGQEGFAEIIAAIWQGLWPSAKRIFRFRLSFTPQDVEGQELTIVAIPEGSENRWSEYSLAFPQDTTEPQTKAEALLLGRSEGAPLWNLLAELEAAPRAISDLKKIEACYEYLEHLHAGELGAGGARMLVRLLGVLSPNASNGVALKSEALQALLELTRRGTSDDVKALRNFDVGPFQSGGEKIKKTVMEWVQQHILANEVSKSSQNADLVRTSFVSTNTSWGRWVQDALRKILSEWQNGTAQTVWLWWQKVPELIQRVEPFLPNSKRTERDLAKNCPRRLSEDIGEMVRSLAQRKGWFVLHAAVVGAYCEPGKALREQMQVDRDESYLEGLRLLAEKIPAGLLLETALETGDPRLLRLTGEACVHNADLMRGLDVNLLEWRKIWLHAVEAGAAIMDGVQNAREVVDQLITLLMRIKSRKADQQGVVELSLWNNNSSNSIC